MDFSTIEITSKKVCGNNVDFSAIEITSKKVRGKKVDFLTIEITLKKVRGNNVDFSTIEITSKKVRGNDVEILRNLVYDVSTYQGLEVAQRALHVKSTWFRRGVPIGPLLSLY